MISVYGGDEISRMIAGKVAKQRIVAHYFQEATWCCGKIHWTKIWEPWSLILVLP